MIIKKSLMRKMYSVGLIIIMMLSAFTIVLANSAIHSSPRGNRQITSIKLSVKIGDWDGQSDNPDFNITVIDQSNNPISWVDIFGPNIPLSTQTNMTGEYLLEDPPADQYQIMAEYHSGMETYFDKVEFLHRLPSSVFLYTDIGIGPFDNDFAGNGSPDDIIIQFFKAFDTNPNNDTNVTQSEVKIWRGPNDPQIDPPEFKRKTDKDGKIFLKDLERDLYKLEIKNNTYTAHYMFDIFYDFHLRIDGYWDMDMDGKWRDADIYLYSDGQESSSVSGATIEVWEGNFKKLICNGTTDSSGKYQLREGKNGWIDNRDGLFKVKAKHNNNITVALMKIGDLFYDAYVCDNDGFGDMNDVTVYVYDEEGPVKDANAYLYKFGWDQVYKKTDTEGYAYFNNLPEGKHRINVEYNGYWAPDFDIRIGSQLFYIFPEYWNEWKEELKRDIFVLKVRVMETPDQWGPQQDSIENARVKIDTKGKLEERKTDWNGEAFFYDIPPGLYIINVTFDWNKNGSIDANEIVVEYDFEVGEATILKINVTDLNLDGSDDISIYAHGLKGEPRSGVWLGVRCEGGDNWVWIDYNLQESDHGYFNITGYQGMPLPDGMYVIEYDHMGIRGKELAFLGDGPFYHIEVKVGDFDEDNESDEAEIFVLDAYTPLPNIEIYVDKIYKGNTNSEGKLLVDNITVGMHSIKAKKKVGDKCVTVARMDRFGVGEFRYIDAWEENRWEDFGTWKYDIRVSVRAWPQEFPVSAEIYLDDVLVGMTNDMGMDSLMVNGVSEGLHIIKAKLAQPYAGESITTEFNAGKRDRYFQWRWFDAHDEGIENDLELSFIEDEEPLLGVEFYVDGWSVGEATIENGGKVIVYNLTPGKHSVEVEFKDGHREWYEVWGGADDFIVIEARVIEEEGGFNEPMKVYVEVTVSNKGGAPVPFVEITFNGRYCGQTNLTGQLMIYDIWERGPCWVEARYWMNDMELWAHTMVFIGQQDVLWVDLGHDENLDNEPNDMRNDIELTVYLFRYADREEYPQGKPQKGAEIYLMGKKKGLTDEDGIYILYNLTDGQYKGMAMYKDPADGREFSWEYRFCIGDHRNFLRAEAWMQGPENRDVEIQVWVGSEWGGEEPVNGAKLFNDNRYFGSTDWDGRYRAYNLDPGYYFLNLTWHNEMRNRDIYGWVDFYIGGKEDYMIVDWYIEDLNNQSEENDLTFFVRNGKEEIIYGAEIFIHGPEERYGNTDEKGKCIFYDLPNGHYNVDIKYISNDAMPGMGMEQWWHCDFVVGDHGFIWVEIWIEARNGFGREDDLTLRVHGGKDRLLEGAEVFIDGMFRGRTNFEGEYHEDDFNDGRYWCEVHYKDMIDGMPMDLHWSGEFFVGEVSGYIWAEVFVYDEQGDENMNDVEIRVYGGRGETLMDAEVFVHGPEELYGKTDPSGSIRFMDLSNGYYTADIVYRGMGYGYDIEMDIIHDPGSEQPTMDKISVDITYPADNHEITPKDTIIVIEGTASTSIQGDYIEDVLMLIPAGSPDDAYSASGDMFMSYTKVPTKPIGPNGSFEKWRFEVPDNPLNSPNPEDRPPLDVPIPIYARAFDDKGGWNQAKINIIFTEKDGSTRGGSRQTTNPDGTYNNADYDEGPPDWITDFYDEPEPFDTYFGAPTNYDIKLSIKAEELIKTNRVVGTCSADVEKIDLYVSLFISGFIEWNGNTFPDGAWTNWVNMKNLEDMGSIVDVVIHEDGTWSWKPPDDDNTRQSDPYNEPYDDYDDNGDGPDAVKIAAVAYDNNGSYSYVVSDEINLPKEEPHEYEGHEGFGEAWAHVDFIIGESGFIFAKAYITAEDADGRMDDVEINVFDAEQNPIEGAEIYIWDTFIGETDSEGSICSHDETPGLDDGYYPVDVIFRGVFECPKCGEEFEKALEEGDSCPSCGHPISDFDLLIYRATTEFVIGSSAIFIKVNAYVKDIDGDGKADDVTIKVNDLNNDPIDNAKVFIDDKFIGKTDEDGYIKEYNLYAGRHTVDVLTEDWYTGFTDFFSEGSGESYIYAEAFVMNMVSIGIPSPKKNDVLIYVYDKKGTPLRDAEVYFNGIYQGQTTIQGFLSMFDQPEGWYAVDVFWFDDAKKKEFHGYTEFKSEGAGDNYVYSDNVVDDADENGYADDAIIVVYDANGDPVENARVIIDGELAGNTSEQGSGTRGFGSLGSRSTNYEAEDISAGWHTITVEYDEIEPFTGDVNTVSSTRVIKSEGSGEDYIYANAFVTDGDNDGNKNDVKVVVSDNSNSPISGATLTINSETFTTDSNGMITIYNYAAGRHSGTVENDDLSCTFSFESLGDGDGNEPPSAEFTMPAENLKTGEQLTFSAQVEEPDGDRYVCIWDFDDGTPEEVGDSVTHVFNDSGEFKVTLIVSDGVDRISYSEKIKIQESSTAGGGAISLPIDNMMLIVIVIVVIIIIIALVAIVKRKKGKRGISKDDKAQGEKGSKDANKGKPKLTPGIYQEPTKKVEKSSKPLIAQPVERVTVKDKTKEDTAKKYEKYRAALKQAWEDDQITDGEETLLKMLRSKYSITDDEHKMIEVEIKLEKEL